MIIYEMRDKDPIFVKLFETLSREERNEIWQEVTGFEYESPVVAEHLIEAAKKVIPKSIRKMTAKEAFDEGIKEGLKKHENRN